MERREVRLRQYEKSEIDAFCGQVGIVYDSDFPGNSNLLWLIYIEINFLKWEH